MKIGKKETSSMGVSQAVKNEGKRSMSIAIVIIITIGLIIWVLLMGHKAQETVKVAVLAQSVYKNQVITADMLEPYEMLRGEFEKLYQVDENGNKQRRILTWDEADKVLNSFAAYPLHKGSYAEYRQFIKSRIDNSDSVLYSFPGKEIVSFEVGTESLDTFKTFLQPGDRINIQAIYSDSIKNGNNSNEAIEIFKTETAFNNVMIADLINGSGMSVLDIYENYNNLTTWEQSAMDESSSFQQSVEPQALLVALTPDELERYYYYMSKENIEFKITLPQRND